MLFFWHPVCLLDLKVLGMNIFYASHNKIKSIRMKKCLPQKDYLIVITFDTEPPLSKKFIKGFFYNYL